VFRAELVHRHKRNPLFWVKERREQRREWDRPRAEMRWMNSVTSPVPVGAAIILRLPPERHRSMD
jgi:hypothetical protein